MKDPFGTRATFRIETLLQSNSIVKARKDLDLLAVVHAE